MRHNEKTAAYHNSGLNKNFNEQGNYKPKKNNFQLNSAIGGCVGCGELLESDNEFLQSIAACRKCLGVYAVILGAIEATEQRRRREQLERFAGGLK